MALLVLIVSGNGRELSYSQSVTPAGCFTYVVTDKSNSSIKFIALDLKNNTATALPATYSGDNIFESIAVDPSTRILYTVALSGYSSPGRLYRVDSMSGNVTLVGNTGYTNVSAIAFKPDGTLWGWDETKGLISINKSTGAASLVYSTVKDFGGMAWNTSGNLLYLSLESKELWTFNPSTNALTRISTNLPYEGDSLTMRPDGVLLGGNGNGGSGKITIYSYNTSTKTSSNVVSITNSYDDVEDIAWPPTCGNPYNPSTPTPSPSPTRSPTPSPTRSPSPTPTRTPSPTPTPTPFLTPACSPSCSLKEIGAINPLFNTFSADGDNTIEMNDPDTWVRLTIQGPSPLASSNIIVNETIDANNFNIVDPQHTSASNYTFKITKKSGASETDVTCADGGDADSIPDCVSKSPATGAVTGLTVTLSGVNSTDIYYIYFRVIALRTVSAGEIDNSSSKLEYVGFGATNPNRFVSIDMHQVNIDKAPAFFQINNGDAYTASTDTTASIESKLPLNTLFDLTNKSIIIARGGSDWGNGNVNSNGWEVKSYNTIDDSEFDYSVYIAKYGKNIKSVDLKNLGYAALSNSDYYIDSTAGAGYTLTIDNTWNSQTIQGKQYVVFVPGDLHINKSFSIAKDGKSSIVFIVKGNIGIDPDVTKVEGIYVAEGVIDTSCRGGFVASSCLPTHSDSLSTKQLTLEGTFFSDDGGLLLDRTPSSSTQAGEIFNYRPDLILNAMTSVGLNQYAWTENIQ